MKLNDSAKIKYAREQLNKGLTFDKINEGIKMVKNFPTGISRKMLVNLRKEMIQNRVLDLTILKKMIIPFAKSGLEVDLEPHEQERIRELYQEVK